MVKSGRHEIKRGSGSAEKRVLLVEQPSSHQIDQPVHAPLQLAHGEAWIIRRPPAEGESDRAFYLINEYDGQGDAGFAGGVSARSTRRRAGDAALFAHGDFGDFKKTRQTTGDFLGPMSCGREAVGFGARQHDDGVASTLDELTLQRQPCPRHSLRLKRLQKALPKGGLKQGDGWKVAFLGFDWSRILVDRHASCPAPRLLAIYDKRAVARFIFLQHAAQHRPKPFGCEGREDDAVGEIDDDLTVA